MKAVELVKTALKESDDKISQKVYSIFLWGIMCGIILAYCSIVPLLVGVVMGYVLAEHLPKNIFLNFIDNYIFVKLKN